MADLPWRVKLYELGHDGQWDDKGTGSIRCSTDPAGQLTFSMRDEKSDEVILTRTVSDALTYERQGENIVTWNEPDPDGDSAGVDLALSFQEHKGTLDVWQRICAAQGQYTSDFEGSGQGGGGGISGRLGGLGMGGGGGGGGIGGAAGGLHAAVRLPIPFTLDPGLEELEQLIDAVADSMLKRETLCELMLEEGCSYLRSVIAVFERTESAGNQGAALRQFCRVGEKLMRLGEPAFVEAVLTDETLAAGLAGLFEYDAHAEALGRPRCHHRRALLDAHRFREVVPVRCEETRRKVRFFAACGWDLGWCLELASETYGTKSLLLHSALLAGWSAFWLPFVRAAFVSRSCSLAVACVLCDADCLHHSDRRQLPRVVF